MPQPYAMGQLVSCINRGQIGANDAGVGVFRSECLFVNCQRLLQVGARTRQVSLGVEQQAEIIQARSRIGVVLAHYLTPDR